ncbi:MAG: response regulator [Candidatus Hydrogenedentes bacterium]|nr:response regulator [Candidatus Hydrogenedentota bacterium]
MTSDVMPRTGAWSGKGTVLLVDDERSVREIGGKMLERAGFDVVVAADGHEALDRFREDTQGKIVCVILDLTMPQMDGAECLHELRNMGRQVPVIISSGYSEQDTADRIGSDPLVSFIQKPYRQMELMALIRQVLEA